MYIEMSLIKFVNLLKYVTKSPLSLRQVCMEGRPIMSYGLDTQVVVNGLTDEYTALVIGVYVASILRWDMMLPPAISSRKCGSLDTQCYNSRGFQVRIFMLCFPYYPAQSHVTAFNGDVSF